MNVERLKTLYSVIAGIPDERFNMDSWRGEAGEWNALRDAQLLNECDSVACAVGWACAYPPFKKEGLKFVVTNRAIGIPKYEGCTHYNAAAAFFNLPTLVALELFRPTTVPGSQKKVFLKRLADLLRKENVITDKRYNELLEEI